MPRFKTGGDESNRRLGIRLFAIGGFFAVCFGVLISRAVFFLLKDNSDIERVAMRQYRTAVQKSTERGKILDMAGRELAINVPKESVFADPRFVRDREETATALGQILKLDAQKLVEMFSTNRKFVWIKRRVSSEEATRIAEARLSGIFLMTENSRSYPNGSLAAAVLGTVGVDAEGLEGIEFQLNDWLLVSNIKGAYKRDALGHLYLSPSAADEKRKPSYVELTLDKTIQYITERELSATVANTRARSGTAIVVDAQNGDILAMATHPTFDPNKFGQHTSDERKNRAIADAYEPGSTFKAVVIAEALDEAVVTPDDVFDCGMGKLAVGKNVVRDAHPHGKLSVADIIKVSSNIGVAHVEAKLGKERLHHALEEFGFGELSGVDLPGESAGILSPSKMWSDLQFVTIAFGQGISATPLQMAMAFAAIANGGELLSPHIVKRIASPDGEVLYERKKEVRGNPIRAEAAAMMRRLLTRVVEEGGTGVLAASQEYPVGGKTGTAQKALPYGGYAEGKYYSSFIGFAPASEPRVVVYVGIDEPKEYYYGGQVAAPVFRGVAEETLHYLSVPVQKGIVVADASLDAENLAEGPLPYVRNEKPLDVPAETQAGSFEAHGGIMPDGRQMWRIPDYTGLTKRGVLEATGSINIALKFVGAGIAVKQNPAAGTVVPAGTRCTVEFRPLL